MIDRLHLQNFKCFDELALPLAPFTLLTGFNAAGKSTALQPALLLAQSLRTQPVGSSIALNGQLVKLGSPGEVLNEHAPEAARRLSIGAGQGSVDARWRLSTEERAGSTMSIDGVEFTGGENGELSIAAWPRPGQLAPDYQRLVDDLREIVFLGAARQGVTDTFPAWELADPVRADVGALGEYAPWWLERHLDEDVKATRRHPGETAPTLRRQLNAWAGEIFPGVDVNAERIKRTSLVSMELRTRITDDYRRPANIGYGLTYTLPLIIALLLAKDGQTIIADSPEAHLHPRGQSAMGRLLAHFAAAGVQIVVETHSDHVLNGMRRAVAQAAIAPEDVVVHFFAAPGDDPHVTALHVNAAGTLDHCPEGFFDQAESDLSILAGWG